MAATAIAVAAVAATAASAASAGYQASQAGSGGSRSPKFTQPPEKPYQSALRRYSDRLLAQGAASVPPSFTDFVSSGGKATFPMGDTRMTPGEAIDLGVIGKHGDIPRVNPGQSRLTPEQVMFLASQGRPGFKKQAREITEFRKLQGGDQNPKTTKRESKLRQDLGYLAE